jgi:NAD(P)-dependent dehydrogenase (short-subunit alcohol dehydrogenase family)
MNTPAFHGDNIVHQLLRKFLVGMACVLATTTAIAAETTATVLITGANRGIGLALVEEFKNSGYTVIGTARKPGAANALKKLGVQVEQLDVADSASVKRLATRLKGKPIDILVNNAGMLNDEPEQFSAVDIDQLDTEFQVNALGPLRVTQALLPNLLASDKKLVANISSMMGSMELNTFGCCLGYRASKAALNSFTKTLAVDLDGQGLSFVVVHPGYVRTGMNDGKGNITAAQSAAGLYSVIAKLGPADNGRFFDYNGKPMPW